ERAGGLATAFGVSDPIRPAGAGSSPRAAAATASGAAALASNPQTGSGTARADRRAVPGRAPRNVRRTPASHTQLAPAYLPAPPPVSIARAAPPVPASARNTAPIRRSIAGAAAGISLVESTAQAFRELESSGRQPQRSTDRQEGSQMTEILPSMTTSRSVESAASKQATVIQTSVLDDPAQMSQLVDEVVDRIERRVVDELERRGRRYTPGAF
ncbi:MAG: hypothetical protein ACRDNS_17910, partial [Trebonia sp.]